MVNLEEVEGMAEKILIDKYDEDDDNNNSGEGEGNVMEIMMVEEDVREKVRNTTIWKKSARDNELSRQCELSG